TQDLYRHSPSSLMSIRTTYRQCYRGLSVLCLLTLICFGASRSGYAGLAAVELVFAALVLLAWSCLGSLRAPLRVPQDFTRCLIGAVLFLITSLIVIVGHRDGAGIAGGVFGILAGVLLGYDAFITLPTRQAHTAAPTDPPSGLKEPLKGFGGPPRFLGFIFGVSPLPFPPPAR
uniref:Proteolipid protein 2 n=1 Tax=Catharus ustulatus TaxID=91951 RepID=A0A8C3UZ48_CATUS